MAQLLVVAFARQRFRECLLPFRRQRDQRDVAHLLVLASEICRAKPRAHMLGDRAEIARDGGGFRDAFQNGRQIADRYALGQQILQHALQAAEVICVGIISATSFCCSLLNSSSSFCVSA